MPRLILTTDDSGAGSLRAAGIADIVLPFRIRFVWGALPSDAKFAMFLAARSRKRSSAGSDGLDFVSRLHLKPITGKAHGLIDFCERCETIELWADPEPNAQLTLIWLLDYLRHHGKTVSKLTLVQANVRIGGHSPEEIAGWRLPAVKIANDHLETASAAWQAYRAPTPQDWFGLLSRDLSPLPQLRQTLQELLGELPADVTTLGATEKRMRERMQPGNAHPSQ